MINRSYDLWVSSKSINQSKPRSQSQIHVLLLMCNYWTLQIEELLHVL
jgi:hypothetical protein